jgi:hypothetical protein
MRWASARATAPASRWAAAAASTTTPLAHFSIGLRGEYYWLRELATAAGLVTTYLRYTF